MPPAASYARGCVDLAARLREPGLEHKATLESELAAAAAGGVTSLACPPDTDPPLDEPGLVEMLKHRARVIDQAHVYPVGRAHRRARRARRSPRWASSPKRAASRSRRPTCRFSDTLMLLRAMQYAGTFGHRVWLRPQDHYLAHGGVAHDGEVATRLGLPAIPVAAETIALATIFGARPRDARRRAPVPAVVGRRRRDGARREARRACRSRATSTCIICTCATSTSAGSTRRRT